MIKIKKYGKVILAMFLIFGFMNTVSATDEKQDVNTVVEEDNSVKPDTETDKKEDKENLVGDEKQEENTAPKEDDSTKPDTKTNTTEQKDTLASDEKQEASTVVEEGNSTRMGANTRAVGDTFTISGLTYEILREPGSGLTTGNCSLKSVNTAVSGLTITIPESAVFNGVSYWVVSLDANALKTTNLHTVHIQALSRLSLGIDTLTFDSLRYLIFDGDTTAKTLTLEDTLLRAFRSWAEEQGLNNLWFPEYNEEKMGNIKIVFPTYEVYKQEFDKNHGSYVRQDLGLYCNYVYNGTLKFHDANDAYINGLDRPALIGKYSSIYYVQDGAGSWTYNENQLLPDVPSNAMGYDAWTPVKGSGYPYKNKNNLGGYYIPPADGNIYLTKVPEVVNNDGSKSKTISKVYDGTAEQLLMKTVGDLSSNSNDRFAFHFSAGHPKTGKTWNQNLIIPKAAITAPLVDKNITTVKNVGDSTTYTAQLENYDKHAYIGFGSTVEEYIPGWTTPVRSLSRSISPLSLNPDVLYTCEANVTVNITPATATMTPQTTTSIIWNNQTTLPTISLTSSSTSGTISWDKEQAPKVGTNDYNYTYIPDNATATNVVTGEQTPNYTNPKITGKIAITYTSQITGVSITPLLPSVKRGSTQQMNAVVSGNNNPSQDVTWSITGNTSATTVIDEAGLLTIGKDETAGETITITATSKEDNTKSTTTKVTVPQPTITTISVTPANPEIIRGKTQQMSASVEGEGYPSQEVTWSISGNTSALTTISEDGLVTIGKDETVGKNITITATSKKDNTKSKTTKITVASPTVTSITITPVTPEIIRGGTQQMSALVEGEGFPLQEVTWSISGNTSALTTISQAGLVTIGKDETVGKSIIITATSKEDNTKSKTAKVAVVSPTVTSVTITPITPEVIRGDTKQMNALVNGDGYPSQEVTWSISGNTSTTTTISEDGLVTIGKDETPGQSIEVKAIAKIDNAKLATTKITVPQPIVTRITLTPENPEIIRGDTQQMKATVEGIGYPLQDVMWSISGQKKDATVISQTGVLTIDRVEAPTKDLEVKVTSMLDSSKIAKTKVTIKEKTIIEEIEEYPLPEDINKEEIKNSLNAILDTKRRYENLSNEDKLQIKYEVAEELNELVGMLDVVTVKITNKTQTLIPKIEAKNLAEMLDLEDTQKLIQGSHTVNVELVIENIADNKVNQSEKEHIQSKISNKTIAMFMDISLYKTLIAVDNPNESIQEKVEKTIQPIKITLDIPEQIKDKKEYTMVRIHQGTVTIIDDIDSNPNTITFYTSQFSTYALAYVEKDKNPTISPANKEDKIDTVNTFDQMNVSSYQNLLLIAMLGIAMCIYHRFVIKKKENKDM